MTNTDSVKINDLYRQLKNLLGENPCREADLEAGWLLEHFLGKSRAQLGPGAQIDREQAEGVIRAAKKRRRGYPLQYILGSWPFFDMELCVGEGVLIPRQATEDVCTAAFEYIDKFAAPTVLDLCSGSGAIALAVKKFCPRSTVVAVEKYPRAYEYLKKNIDRTGLSVLPVMADVFRYDYTIEEESFDVIISNPPYIPESQKSTLQKELDFEPSTALFAPREGLRFYKFIAQYYRPALSENGYLIFEYGYDQAKRVRDILFKEKYRIVKEITDSRGMPRGIIAQKG